MADESTTERVKEQGREVAQTASEEAGRVAGTVKEQAAEVGHEVAVQGREVVARAKEQFRSQADTQAREASEGLRRLGGQARALAEGRVEEAGALGAYVRQAGERIDGVAGRLEEQGVDGVLGDVQDFARRRPGLFLAGAAVAGFAVGRMIRGARDASSSEAPSTPPSRDAIPAAPEQWPTSPRPRPNATPTESPAGASAGAPASGNGW
jgi:hypothetical protein